MTSGWRIFSSVFAMGEMSEMGRYDVPKSGSLLGLCMGAMFESFHMCGMVFVLSASEYSAVRYAIARGPRCLRCRMFMPSGPVELLVLLLCMACDACCGVIVMCSDCRLRMRLVMVLFVLRVRCGIVFVNCLLNAFALSECVTHALLLMSIVRLGCAGGCLPASLCTVRHSMCVLVRWSHDPSMCVFHVSALCCVMSVRSLLLSAGRSGWRGSCVLIV